MIKKRFEIITTVLFVLIVVFAALIAVRFFRRADITENKVYTISGVSKNLFTEIPEQVHITYYRSEKLTALSSIPEQVEDLLYEYSAHSRGKITVEVIDPAERGIEQEAEALGIVPQQIEVLERNERSLAIIYTGIVIRYLDDYSSLPFVGQIETLEYELTTNIRSLLEDRERVIGIVLGDLSRSLQQDYSMLMAGLQEQFEVRELPLGEPIPDDIPAVIVVGNQNIQKENLEPIDSYLMSGGSICFLADAVAVNLQANLAAVPVEDNALLEMLETYGVTVEPKLVLDTFNREFRVPARLFGNIAWQIIGPYPHWVVILGENVSKENPITARFGGVDLLWPNPLNIEPPEGVESQELIKSSEESWLMEDNFNTNPYEAPMFEITKGESQGQYVLGAVMTGEFPSHFSDRISEPTRVLVIGDSDFISNIVQYSDSLYNVGFIQNAGEWLTNDDDLIRIKTRSVRDMRLNKISDPERKSRAYLFSVVLNIVVIPVIVILLGIRRFTVRRKKQYRTEE